MVGRKQLRKDFVVPQRQLTSGGVYDKAGCHEQIPSTFDITPDPRGRE